MTWLVLLLLGGLLVWGYGCHQRQIGILEGEIKARGVAIKQLGELAAKRDLQYREAVIKYKANPTPEGCSLVMLTCDQRDSAKTAQIKQLNEQIKALTVRGKSSIWSKLPWALGGVAVGKILF